jgi:hypothetical protein
MKPQIRASNEEKETTFVKVCREGGNWKWRQFFLPSGESKRRWEMHGRV